MTDSNDIDAKRAAIERIPLAVAVSALDSSYVVR